VLVDNGYPVDKNLLGRQQVGRLGGWIGPGPDARSNNVKRLNDDDESLAQLALQKQQTTCFVPQ